MRPDDGKLFQDNGLDPQTLEGVDHVVVVLEVAFPGGVKPARGLPEKPRRGNVRGRTEKLRKGHHQFGNAPERGRMLLHVGVRVVDDGPTVERNLLANIFKLGEGGAVRGLQRHEVACPHQKNRSHVDEVVSSLLRPDHAHQQIVQRRELRFPKSRRVVAEVLEDVHGRPVDERRTVEHDQPGNVGLYAVDDVTIRPVITR